MIAFERLTAAINSSIKIERCVWGCQRYAPSNGGGHKLKDSNIYIAMNQRTSETLTLP